MSRKISILKQYLPSVFFILTEEELNSKKIDKSLKKESDRLLSSFNENGEVVGQDGGQNSIFFDIVHAIDQDRCIFRRFDKHVTKMAKSRLELFDETFHQIALTLSDKEIGLIKATVLEIFEHHNWNHLNHLGELGTLLHIKQQGPNITLIDREREMENGKRIDFVFRDSKGKETLVEVVSSQCRSNQDDLVRFLIGKNRDKMQEKFRGESPPDNFSLYHVIRGCPEKIKSRVHQEIIDQNPFSLVFFL